MGWTEFTKVKKIGEGSFGKAWLVKANKENKSFVIKEINISRMPVRERDEARKEVAVLAQMKHPNIVSYIDSFEEIGSLCIVMDYCDGGDLYSRIVSQRGICFSEEQILDWFVQITLALKHVHDRKILHRDLKSQNIFLSKDGSVKLGDFGVAKVLANTMELAKTAIGTPYYMSPEICESKPYNNKSDVWSLGCVLYELTNLKHPFEANDVKNLVLKILRGNFEPIKPVFSYDLRNLVASMLKRNPKERPSVNGILRKAFIMKRCQKFLTNEKLVEEFSHTVLHGENIAKKLQQKNVVPPRPLANRYGQSPSPSPIIKSPASPLPKQYDPSKIYKNPLPIKRPQMALQKSVDKKNIPSNDKKKLIQRPLSSDKDQSSQKRPQSSIEQKKRQNDIKDELIQPKKQLDNFLEKQKHDRIKKERELGWQNVLFNSWDSKENSNSSEINNAVKPEINNKPQPIKEKEPILLQKNNNPYARYYEALDQHNSKIKEKEQGIIKVENKAAYDQAFNRKPVLKEKNPIVNEYLQRKEEAARNKARDQGLNLFNKPPISPANVKKNPQESYLETLNNIRLQNLNRKIDKEPVVSHEPNIHNQQNRLKQIEALKKQSEEQAKKLHQELEKRRMEAYQREQKQWQKHIEDKVYERKDLPNNNRPFVVPPATPLFEPSTKIGMTEALGAIGITNNNNNVKQIKENILRNLNEKEAKINKNENDRKGWQQVTDLSSLNQKPLTNSIINPVDVNKPQSSDHTPRKIWDQPHQTVLKALEDVELSGTAAATSLDTVKIPSNKKGETFVIDKNSSNFKQSLVEEPVKTDNKDKPSTLKSQVSSDTLQSIIDLTKSILLGVTAGQYDLANTKLLRTCSEPDMTKLFQLNKINDAETTRIKELGKSESSSNVNSLPNETIKKRLVKSSEDLVNTKVLSTIDSIDVTNTLASELLSDENTVVTLINSDFDHDEDDVTEVTQNMKKFLTDELTDDENDDSGNEDNYSSKIKRKSNKIKILSSSQTIKENDMITKDRFKTFEKSFSSDIDDNNNGTASVTLTLPDDDDDDSGSDTEFEDDFIPTLNIRNSYNDLEEKRDFLEKQLGTENFIQLYKAIESYAENNSLKDLSKISYENFRSILPENKKNIFEEVLKLVIEDNNYHN